MSTIPVTPRVSIEDLEKVGFYPNSRTRGNRFAISLHHETEITINPIDDWHEIFTKIYDEGRKSGYEEGKRQQLTDIQRTLGIPNNTPDSELEYLI